MRASVALLLMACAPQTQPDPRSVSPEGSFETGLLFWMPATFPYTTRPTARLQLGPDGASGAVREIWRVDSPWVSDCPTVMEFDSVREGVNIQGWVTYMGDADLIDDPCALQAYGGGLDMMLTVAPASEAEALLVDAGLEADLFHERRLELEDQRGQEALPWFLFWGPDALTLWPVGHLFEPMGEPTP